MAESLDVLIVDSDENNALFWEMLIKNSFEGSNVTISRTGFEAIDVAKQGKFNFFIASWELQGMSGFVFMQKIREQRKYRYHPILIFSSILKEDEISLAGEFGVKNFLLKPFDKAKVLDKMQKMLKEERDEDPALWNLRKIEEWILDDKVTDALKLISQYLKNGPHAARAFSLAGDLWSRTRHTDKAEEAYKKSLDYESDYLPALNGLGKLYLKLKRIDEATEIFERANQQIPNNLERMLNLGNAYLEKGNTNKAEEMFEKVKAVDEDNPEAAAGMGKVAFAEGNLDLAAQFFRESGKGDELAGYFNNNGIMMVNQGKYDEAISLYSNAIRVLPTESKVHFLEFNIGLAYKKSGRNGPAAEAFARSLIQNPSYEKAFQGLAVSIKDAQKSGESYDNNVVQQAIKAYRAVTTTPQKS